MSTIPQLPTATPAGADYVVLSQGGVASKSTVNALAMAVGVTAEAARATAAEALALPKAGGTMTGNLSPYSIDGAVYASAFASIQAAHDALPSTGGKIILPPNVTFVLSNSTNINVTKPNVTIEAPNWNTVIQRGAGNTGTLINATGTNFVIRNVTVDGNGTVVPVHFAADVGASGDLSLVEHCNIVNSSGNMALALSGNGSRASYNTIAGLGISLSTQRGYGIWAINHQTVYIDHNTIIGTCIDAIGFDGNGSKANDNNISGCHCYTGGGGGQGPNYYTGGRWSSGTITGSGTSSTFTVSGSSGSIVAGMQLFGGTGDQTAVILSQLTGAAKGDGTYQLSVTQAVGANYVGCSTAGAHIENNWIGQGGASTSGGLEIDGLNVIMVGNHIENQYSQGIMIGEGQGFTVVGNTIRNCALGSDGNHIDGITIGYSPANVINHVLISGNRIIDDRPTPTMRWAVAVNATTGDYITITGNHFTPGARPTSEVSLSTSGTHCLIQGNSGMDNAWTTIFGGSGALSIPSNASFAVANANTYTSIVGTFWQGRQILMHPMSAFTMTAGNNIANTITAVVGQPMIGLYDGTLWHFR